MFPLLLYVLSLPTVSLSVKIYSANMESTIVNFNLLDVSQCEGSEYGGVTLVYPALLVRCLMRHHVISALLLSV